MSYFQPDVVSATLRERFFAKTERTACGCLMWTGAVTKHGYGRVSYKTDRSTLAHKAAWFLETGEWPDHNVLHTCDTPGCVEYEHLFKGTQQENLTDMDAKGRRARGAAHTNAKLTDADMQDARWLKGWGVSLTKIARLFDVSRATLTVALSREWRG